MTSKQGRKTLAIESNIQSLFPFLRPNFKKIMTFKIRGFHSLTRKQKNFSQRYLGHLFGTNPYIGHTVEQNVNHPFVMRHGGLLLRILGIL